MFVSCVLRIPLKIQTQVYTGIYIRGAWIGYGSNRGFGKGKVHVVLKFVVTITKGEKHIAAEPLAGTHIIPCGDCSNKAVKYSFLNVLVKVTIVMQNGIGAAAIVFLQLK